MAHRAVLSFVLAAALCLAGAATADAAPSWLAPLDVSALGGSASDAHVAVDSAGDSFAVWKRFDGSNDIVQASVRPAGGPDWSAPQDLSALGFGSFKQHVATDPQGDAVVAWARTLASGNDVVEASLRAAGAPAWGAAQPVSATGGQIQDVNVAMDAAGGAVAVWRRSNGTHTIIQASRLTGGTWSQPKDLSPSTEDAHDSQVAIDPGGDAVAVWVHSPAAHSIVAAAKLAAGATDWTTPKDLSDNTKNAFEPDVAIDPAGNATAVWSLDTGSGRQIQSATLPAASPVWSTPIPVSGSPALFGTRQHIVVDAAGNAYASWVGTDGSNEIIQASVMPAGSGSWSTPQPLSATGQNAFQPDIGVNASGEAIVVWDRSDGANDIVQAAVRPAGASAFGASLDLSMPGQTANDARVDVDAAGDATAVWSRSNGTDFIAQATGYDGAGPQLRSLYIPAHAFAFTPVAFSVVPLDVWSAVGTESWSFGDGSSPVSGLGVTHTFTKTGTFTVSVSSPDSLGNVSSASAALAVTLAPPAVSALSQTARKWREGKRLPHFSRRRRGHVGTVFRFTLNEPATVKLVFKRRVAGRRSGRRCVAPNARNRHRRRCTRTVTAGRLSHAGKLGANRLAFQGRLSRHRRLKPGRYTLLLSLVNASGQKSRARSVSFTILR